MEGKTQETAAATAGMSVPTARKWRSGVVPSERRRTPRTYRTRKDPFDEIWDAEIVSWLKADEKGVLQATTLMDELEQRYPGRFVAGQVRSLQRRMRDWRAVYGPEKPVYFEQDHPPGRMASADFTHATELDVTIRGKVLHHLFFELVLGHSGWTWVSLAFGETYEALVDGLQRALWSLGGVPKVVRLDNLSAATHELRKGRGRGLNKRFKDVLDHYRLASSHIQPGQSHENGVVEQRHFRTKSAVKQALVLRGSRDFVSEETYEQFVKNVVDRFHNQKCLELWEAERAHLGELPPHPIPSHTEFTPVVRRWSTITVGGRRYSVPSRLIGHSVRVLRHADTVEVYYGAKLIETMPRIRGEKPHRIDYRHIADSLRRKPGAFACYRYREELFPSLVFRRAYDALVKHHGSRADVEYVRILHLAATTMECDVQEALSLLLETGQRFDYLQVKDLAHPDAPEVPKVAISTPNLAAYDALLEGGVYA